MGYSNQNTNGPDKPRGVYANFSSIWMILDVSACCYNSGERRKCASVRFDVDYTFKGNQTEILIITYENIVGLTSSKAAAFLHIQ